MMRANQSAAANRRPALQSDGSGDLAETVAANRAFPAAVAELGRSLYPADQKPLRMIAIGHLNDAGHVGAACQPADHDHRCGGEPGLAWSAFPAATLTPLGSEPDGPANGSQPARRVAMPTPLVAGPRR